MIKRIKNWFVDSRTEEERAKPVETITTIAGGEETVYVSPVGPEESEWLGEGTHEEWEEQQRKDKGMDKWYKRIGM